jgi:hypothetical protein
MFEKDQKDQNKHYDQNILKISNVSYIIYIKVLYKQRGFEDEIQLT